MMQNSNANHVLGGRNRETITSSLQERINTMPQVTMGPTTSGPSPAGSSQDPMSIFQNGSVSLKSQMLARTAQNQQQQQHSTARLPPQFGHNRPQLDPSILSRMVTAQGSGANTTQFRAVASMQDFRRSSNSLNTVPESYRQLPRRVVAPNQAFALHQQGPRRSALASQPSHRPMMASNNPLLKMMEERMAAKEAVSAPKEPALPTIAASPSPPPLAPMSDDDKAALKASISKWAGVSDHNEEKKSVEGHENSGAVQNQPMSCLPQTSTNGLPSGSRGPLSHTQKMELLKEMAASQNQHGMNLQSSQMQQLLGGVGQTSVLPHMQQAPMNSAPGLTRSAVSFAEVDRLRRENQYIQLRQQMAVQERARQEQINAINEQAYLRQRNIAASALASMPATGGGGRALTQGGLNSLQVNTLHTIKSLSPSSTTEPSGMMKTKSSLSLRKRRSLRLEDDDESHCSNASLTSHTHSISSSTQASHKIHRSLSHCSARAALSGSMENLRIQSGLMSTNSSMRNQSFSSGLNVVNQSFASTLNMQNQSFSSGSHVSSVDPQRNKPSHVAAALRRSSSSNNYIKSLLSDQKSAGKAAATFEHALKISSTSLVSLPKNNQPSSLASSPPKEQPKASPPKPIQVRAEEYAAPCIERPKSTSSEMVIISAVPDSIKYQNAKDDTKPLDIVKEALSSRGAKPDTKPSIDMENGFFHKITDMYDQEVVNAIRSNDVESLRKLHANGINLQCGNRFGETLIHLACRRSQLNLVSFLVKEVGVTLRVRDDFGRTPMHDACWRAEPNLELLDMLLDLAPELLMLSDKRGHTPLDYARREHWDVLKPFLLERTSKFQSVI
ncbi:hypothetical protein ACHAXR_003794 [Thalassiosira sp. AJA248-18]